MAAWFAEHLWTSYIIIFVFLSYIYNKVFRVRKLPLLKMFIVYVLIAIGSVILLFFQVDAGLPIIPSLTLAIILILIVRIRYFLQERSQRKPESEK